MNIMLANIPVSNTVQPRTMIPELRRKSETFHSSSSKLATNRGVNGSNQQALTNVTAVGLDSTGRVYAGDNTIVCRLN